MLAPIILFVYNRPEHTERTLESLKKNELFNLSNLYIFSDGPKNSKDAIKVEETRSKIKFLTGAKKINLIQHSENFGLQKSVIYGVSKIFEEYSNAIILEDDLVFSQNFLVFMNKALEKYEENKKIQSIGGYTPNIEFDGNSQDSFFLSYRCCTWGWATWKDRWEKVDWELKDFSTFISNKKLKKNFSKGGADLVDLIKMSKANLIDSWAIKWDYHHFKSNTYCFRPVKSLVLNTGNDGTGTHCGRSHKFDVQIEQFLDFKLPNNDELFLNKILNQKLAHFYDGLTVTKSNGVYELIRFFKNIIKRKILIKLYLYITKLFK